MPCALQELVDAFQKHTSSSKKLATIEDMQNFVEVRAPLAQSPVGT